MATRMKTDEGITKDVLDSFYTECLISEAKAQGK